MLTPDTAHGTNPATVTMAGYEVVKVASDERGGIDVDDLRAKADDDVACLMLTNPNTLGLFDERIEEIARSCTTTGATLYYDGANLNAVMGISRPGDMGFDIVHVNLHKSFSQPHGGGGPGAGPIAVSERIEPYLPRPQVVRREESQRRPAALRPRLRPAQVDRPAARLPGQLRRVRALLRVHPQPRRRRPARGLRDGRAERELPARADAPTGARGKYLPVAFDRRCKHEFVLSGAQAKRELGVKTLDIAKRLLDFGFHPPTVYFPLLVDEALMVEPTETEAKETLDAFAAAVDEILAEAEENPEIAQNAPYTTPVRRLDEVAREPASRSCASRCSGRAQ